MGQRIERYFWNEKENLLKTENNAPELNKRLFLYYQILISESDIFFAKSKRKFCRQKNADT